MKRKMDETQDDHIFVNVSENPNVSWKKLKDDYLKNHDRYVPIDNPIEKIEDLKDLPISEYHRVRQRSEAWFHLRKYHKKKLFGGSSLGNILGLHTKTAYDYFKKDSQYTSNKSFEQTLKSQEKEFSKNEQLNMNWGKDKEDDALYYFLETHKNLRVYEIGTYIIELKDKPYDLIVSPDGICEDINTLKRGVIELKAPTPFIFNNDTKKYQYISRKLQETIIFYYVPQIMFEAMAAKMDNGWFNLYFPTNGAVSMYYEYDQEYIDFCFIMLDWAYDKYVINNHDVPNQINISPYYDNDLYNKFLSMTKEKIKPLKIEKIRPIDNLLYCQNGKKFLDEDILKDKIIKEKSTKIKNQTQKKVYEDHEINIILNSMNDYNGTSKLSSKKKNEIIIID